MSSHLIPTAKDRDNLCNNCTHTSLSPLRTTSRRRLTSVLNSLTLRQQPNPQENKKTRRHTYSSTNSYFPTPTPRSTSMYSPISTSDVSPQLKSSRRRRNLARINYSELKLTAIAKPISIIPDPSATLDDTLNTD